MPTVINRFSIQILLTGFVIALFTTGCSISASSESSSKIIASPFKSSSASSSRDSSDEYENEVRDYTYAYVRSSAADYTGFKSGLAEIASRHGVTNWEVQPLTYVSIGRGLRKANIKGIEYETFKKNFAAGDFTKMQDIEKGYRAE